MYKVYVEWQIVIVSFFSFSSTLGVFQDEIKLPNNFTFELFNLLRERGTRRGQEARNLD